MLLDDRFIIVPVFLLLYRRRTRAQLDARIIVHKPVSPISKCLLAHLSTFTSLFYAEFQNDGAHQNQLKTKSCITIRSIPKLVLIMLQD